MELRRSLFHKSRRPEAAPRWTFGARIAACAGLRRFCYAEDVHREQTIRSLADEPLDLLVIGGGIVGAGVLRDAAMRGLRAGLIEQNDFAFGTSSRTSRLLHGGLRYLAQGRLGLVRQSSKEKRVLHRIAPHLCRPLAFVFPTYVRSQWPHWKLTIGVKLYDLLCGGRNFGTSESLNKTEALERLPGLRAAGLAGAVRYFDGFTNDARLVIDTLRSAANAGGRPLNYARFTGAQYGSGLWRCEFTDLLHGHQYSVRTRSVVNATGPWADGLPNSAVKLRLTKGIHIVIDRTRVPAPDAVVMTDRSRILFVIPWGERVIIGTTDSDYSGPLDHVRSEPDEINYLLGITNQYFPDASLTSADVISTWAGLRPLIADPTGAPSDISRSHQIRSPQPGWWDVTGGKLTTYRLMAEQTLDQVARALRSHPTTLPCRTADEPLLPNETGPLTFGVEPPSFSRQVVEHSCTAEWALHLDDVMVRRTNWHYYHADGASKAREVAVWMRSTLDWTSAQLEEELHRYLAMKRP